MKNICYNYLIMKKILALSIILLFTLLIPTISFSEICRSSYQANTDNCESICQNVLIPNSKVQYENHYETTLSSVGSGNFLSVETQKRCVCLYRPDTDQSEEVGSNLSICEYTVTKLRGLNSVSFSNFDIPNKPINNLIKFATLQPADFGSSGGGGIGSKLGFASSVIANVYYRGLHYFSSYYALILLTILFAGTLFLFGFGNFFTILKSPQQIWSLLTGTDFKSKSAQVILAIIFFGLPVNIETVYSTSVSNNQQNNQTSQNNYTNLSRFLLSHNVTEQCGTQLQNLIEAEVNWKDCLRIKQRTSNQSSNLTQQQSNNNNIQSSNLTQQQFNNNNTNNITNPDDEDLGNVQMPDDYINVQLGAQNNCTRQENDYYQKYNDFVTCSQNALGGSNNDTDRDLLSSGNNATNTLIQRRSIRDGLQVPFATVIVAGFVNFGVGVAEKIANWASEGVKSYFYYKLVYNNAASKKSLQQLNNEIQSRGRAFKFTITLPKYCGFGSGTTVQSCAEIQDIFKDGTKNFERGYCSIIIEDAKKRCENLYAIHANISKAVEKAQLDIKDQINQRYSQAMNQIQSNFSFLAPALIPMTIITYPFQQLEGKQPNILVTADKVSEQNSDPLLYASWTTRAYDFIKIKITSAWNKTTGTIKQLYNLATLAGNEANMMEDEIGKIIGNTISRDKQIAYWLGYASIITAIPPGSQVKSFLNNFFEKVFKVAGATISLIFSLLGLIITGGIFLFASSKAAAVFAVISMVLGSALEKTAPIIALAVEWALTYIAVNITVMLLLILPFFAITIAGVVRFIHYIYEIIKTMIALPFYALPVATRRAEGAFIFFGDLVKLSVIPILIAAGVAFAIFFAIIFEFFIFDMPFHLVLSQVLPDSYASLFMFGVIVACLQIVTTFVTTYYLFKITMGFPEYIMNAIARLIGLSHGSREYEHFAQQTLEKTKIAMIARM